MEKGTFGDEPESWRVREDCPISSKYGNANMSLWKPAEWY